jgi:hypothetical protein
MAAPTVTPAEVQAALSVASHGAKILRSEQIDVSATAGHYLVQGGATVPGRTRWVAITNTDNAATQVTAILSGLRA